MGTYKPCMTQRRAEYRRNGVFKCYQQNKEELFAELDKTLEKSFTDLEFMKVQFYRQYIDLPEALIKTDAKIKQFVIEEAKKKDALRKDIIDSVFLRVACEEEFEPGIQYYIKDDRLIEFLSNLPVDVNGLPDVLKQFKNQHFCIHTHRAGITIAVNESSESIFTEYDDGKDVICRFASCKNDYKSINRQFKKEHERFWTLQFCLNLLTYMKEYPDQVVFGLPNDLNNVEKKMLQKSSTKKNTIGSADWINEESVKLVKSGGNFKCPHLRKAHTRTFTADRFINMKGKTIEIGAIEVKGRSKIIKNKYKKEI